MPESQNPSFVKILYHSNAGPHTMEVPTLQWNESGTFDVWGGGTVVDHDMVEAFVTLLLPFFGSDTEFESFIIYNVPTPGAAPQPVASFPLSGMVGSASSPGWTTAVQGTFSIRTTLFGLFKITMLDGASGNSFAPSTALGGDALALFEELISDANGWSGRDNGQPNVFIKFTKTLNEKLRRSYRLT
jgi:hypothetical protein